MTGAYQQQPALFHKARCLRFELRIDFLFIAGIGGYRQYTVLVQNTLRGLVGVEDVHIQSQITERLVIAQEVLTAAGISL